jgi:hypothetical protein
VPNRSVVTVTPLPKSIVVLPLPAPLKRAVSPSTGAAGFQLVVTDQSESVAPVQAESAACPRIATQTAATQSPSRTLTW